MTILWLECFGDSHFFCFLFVFFLYLLWILGWSVWITVWLRWKFPQDFYERYALYERHNLHGRLKRPGFGKILGIFFEAVPGGYRVTLPKTAMCWDFMAVIVFFWICLKRWGGKNNPLLVCLIHELFCTLSKSYLCVPSIMTLGLEVVSAMSWYRTRWRPNPYAREDADFAQQNIRTLLRPFSHFGSRGNQGSHSKGDMGLESRHCFFFLRGETTAAGRAQPRCSMYREHYRWHSSPLARVTVHGGMTECILMGSLIKVFGVNFMQISVSSGFVIQEASFKSSFDTLAMMHHSMNPLTLQQTFQPSPCLGLKQLLSLVWDVSKGSKGNTVQQTSSTPQAFWGFIIM